MRSPEDGLSAEESAAFDSQASQAAREAYAALEANLRTLPDKPEETAASALRALWHLAAGEHLSATEALSRPLPALNAEGLERFASAVGRRLAGTPLAYLTGRQRFMGLEMIAGPGALIPRKETEIVARAAVQIAKRIADERGHVKVMDVCTGSGNVAAAVAVAEPRAMVYASDLSDDAVELAQRNFEHLGVQLRVTLRVGDLMAPFDLPELVGKVDLLTCNPPYISTARVSEMPNEISRHEPKLAFDGGPLGVRILQRLIREAPRILRPGGWLAFEVGIGQGTSASRRIRTAGAYTFVETVADEGGQVRVLLAQTSTPVR